MSISKVSLFLVTAAFFSCGTDSSDQPEIAVQPAIHTLIFIDKTESVDVKKPFVAEKYRTALQQIIEENIRQGGDKLDVYFIHENTSKARAMSVTSRSDRVETDGMNATDLEASETTFNLLLRKERDIFTQQATRQLMTKNSGASNQETNITASIPIIAKVAEAEATVRVYYFSDMVESLKNSRDFHKGPPKDATQAIEWATQDAEKFKSDGLENVAITMILPFEATSSSKENNPNITEYWNTLFKKLSVKSVEES